MVVAFFVTQRRRGEFCKFPAIDRLRQMDHRNRHTLLKRHESSRGKADQCGTKGDCMLPLGGSARHSFRVRIPTASALETRLSHERSLRQLLTVCVTT